MIDENDNRDRQPSPVLARRRENRKSTIKSGRVIGEKRERLETANERAAIYKKNHRKSVLRIVFTIIGFIGLIIILILLLLKFTSPDNETEPFQETIEVPVSATIEIIDEDAHATNNKITSRMNEYIGQAETDFRALGYTPIRAVLPSGSIREVDFYLDGYTGYIKLIIDRGSAVSVEDADRMLRYLKEQGINDFEYIDVRIEGRAFWK